MSQEFCVKAAICPEYEKLLEECNRALNIWNEQRAAVCESGVSGKKVGDELLRLQAKYAKAYSVLQNHARDCLQCQMAARVDELMSRAGRSDSENQSEVFSEDKLPA
jgi:hypothetical protein